MKPSRLFRQSRRFKINVFLPAALLALSACSGIRHDIAGKDAREWWKYLENDRSLQEITFSGKVGADPQKTGSGQGSAHIKKPFGGIYTTESLGTIYSVGNSENIILINLETNKGIDISNPTQRKELQKSKKIKLYEFGGGIIGSIVYSAANHSVCQAFADGKEKIRVRSVTNYYLDPPLRAKSDFFATVIEADLFGDKGFEIKNWDLEFHVGDKNSADLKDKEQSDPYLQDILREDVQRQERFLPDAVCSPVLVK